MVGKSSIFPDLRHFNKCGRILGTSKFTETGFCPYARHVAKAMANTPQSLPLLCYWTFTLRTPLKFGPNKFAASSCNSRDTGENRLSRTMT